MKNKGFEFRESDHKYFYDGKPMTGVTTVLGVIAKPALISWAARMAVDYLKNHALWNTGELIPDEVLEEAKNAHNQKRDKAAEQGTDVHALIENYVKNCIADFEGRAIDIETNSNIQLRHFIDWSRKHKIKFLESEKRVYNKDLFLAGTADLVCEIDGKKYIGDIKTTSGIYDLTPFAQCAAYAKMLDYELDGTIIINLKKDGKFNEEKDVYYRYDLETDWKFFEAALTIYRLKATWKK